MEGLFPREIFSIFGIPIRDTVIYTWFIMAVIAGAACFLGKRQPAMLEMVVDFVIDDVTSLVGREGSQYVSLLGTLIIFLAVANNIGIVPVVNSPTDDINTPVALALIVFFSVHYFGIREKGMLGYLKHLATPIVVLPLELVGQVSRTISLAIRLFGNVLSTDIIVAVIFSLFPLLVPLPLVAFSILTGLLQAYIFTVLAAVYISAAVEAQEPI